MIFEWMSDPSAWVGLATLIVLEIVLGIDNLVFIAILAEKLPPEQRTKARIVGLILALGMRLILLASIAWVVTLTQPLFHILNHPFSGRDLILLFGGVFLLFKGTMELHERMEGKQLHKEDNPVHAAFWMVIVQIVVLDAVFSLDSVITAVGMVKELSVMMVAVVIAVGIMLWASRPLMDFVNKHNSGYSMSWLLDDDWFLFGGGRFWFPYSEGLFICCDWFLDFSRNDQPNHASQPREASDYYRFTLSHSFCGFTYVRQ